MTEESKEQKENVQYEELSEEYQSISNTKENNVGNFFEVLFFIISITILVIIFVIIARPSHVSYIEVGSFVYGIVIIAFMPYGYISLLKVYKKIRKNKKWLDKIEDNGNRTLEKYTTDNIGYNIEDVDSILLENLKYSLPMPAPVKMVQRVVTRAKDWRFDSPSEIVYPFIEEIEQDEYRFESFQKQAIRLGILGTFIGLIIAINQNTEILTKLSTNTDAGKLGVKAIEGMIKSAISKDSALVENLFCALKISFSTSIAGLVAAFMLSVMLSRLRLKSAPMLQIYQDVAITVTNVAMRAAKNKSFLEEFGYIKDIIKKHEENTEKKIAETTSELKEVNKKIKEQQDKIDKGIENLDKKKDSLDNYLEKTSKMQEEIIANLEKLYEYTEFKDVLCTVKTTINESSVDARNKLEAISKDFSKFIKGVSEKNNKEVDKLNTKISSVSNTLNSKGTAINRHFEAISNSSVQIKNTLNNIQNTIKMQPIQGSSRMDLYELNRFVKYLLVIGTIAVSEGLIFLILVLN